MPENEFSPNCAGQSSQIRIEALGQGFDYWYADASAGTDKEPTCTHDFPTPSRCYTTPPQGYQPCTPNVPSTIDGLRAALAATTNEQEQQALLGELVLKFLTDTTVTFGLDSAIAVIDGNPSYEELQKQLEERKFEYVADFGDDSTQLWRGAGPTAGGGRKLQLGKQQPAAEARASIAPPVPPASLGRVPGDTVDYFQRVRCLLRPYRSDSARAVAFATDPTLRATFVAMAEDSTAWGSPAARAALNQYAGTEYAELDEFVADSATAARTTTRGPDGRLKPRAEPTPERVASIVLVPNPSTGHVRVGYGLPRAARTVEMRVYDSWGQLRGTYALDDEALAAGVTLALAPGIYQCQLVADGAVVARERLLIQPR
jgi:hypothetical protein